MSEGEETPPAALITEPVAPPIVPPREHLITTAIKFLNNPNVMRSAINQKQAFLRSKGFTEDEIQLACERAGVFTNDPNVQNHKTVINMGVGSNGYTKAQYAIQPHQTWFGKIKEVLSSVALIGGLMYGVYLFYKKFVEPLIFRNKKKKPVDEQIADLNKNVEVKIDKLNSELIKIKDELSRVNQSQSATKELTNFKTDLDSIKGLLLNRKQFASPNLPVLPPSIPAWQLQSQSQEQTPNSEGEPDKIDDNDTGSGSGSSEHDAVLKNSDSSLEIIS
ncbi:peroxisomal membrane protein PEX14 isoform X1 [Topomyia yanbarensis]|uniref:peroxisomal membrane protein PEX14 isoform X1 n=1 Tax=Topomyia yanbarensis TaxID=2498891 RepID=UPI00273BDD82|nr:peroxisomal membrane protein PEX14 isoform X1 [Topomyia yanbarensis]